MVNIPGDVMLDICIRLPVKSVGRFRCVNKTWRKLLSHRKFVQKHLDHATKTNKLNLMLYSRGIENLQGRICTIEYDPSSFKCTGSVNTNLPFVHDKHCSLKLELVGHCNGIVCLKPYNMRNLCLWNPATNEYKVLPEAPLYTTGEMHTCLMQQVGFGYDHKIGKFKVVILATYGYPPTFEVQRTEVYLYTLGSDTWITLESIPYIVSSSITKPDIARVPINGVIYWEAYQERIRSVILSFDFEKEIFQEMRYPDLLSKELAYLCVLGGSLCICDFDSNIGVVEVWEFKGSEVRKSWNKVFTIDMKKHFAQVIEFVPFESLKNGEFLFGLDTDAGFHVHQYDLKHETPRLLYIHENPLGYCVPTSAVYVESLVSLNPSNYVDDNNYAEDNGDADI